MKISKKLLLLSIIMLSGCDYKEPPAPDMMNDVNQVSNAPLYRQNMDHQTFMLWVEEAAMTAYTYSYTTYHEDFAVASHYFTPKGWEAFSRAVETNGNLQKVIDGKLIVTATSTGIPIVLHEGTKANRYEWVVQIPLTIQYRSTLTESASKQNVMVTMRVIRTQGHMGVLGLAIKDFYTRVME